MDFLYYLKIRNNSLDFTKNRKNQFLRTQLTIILSIPLFLYFYLVLVSLTPFFLEKVLISSILLPLIIGGFIYSQTSHTRRKRTTTMNPAHLETDYKPDLVFDQISFILIVVTFIYLTFIIVNFNQSDDPFLQQLGYNGIIVTILALVGFVMMLFFATVGSADEKLHLYIRGFDRSSLTLIVEGMAIAIIGISVTNFILFGQIGYEKYAITGFDLFAFNVLIAITEELLFSFLFQVTFRFLFKSKVIGILARGFGFSIYHYAVYSHDIRLMISTLIGGIFLAISLERSDRLTTNILVHIIINSLASAPLLTGTYTTAPATNSTATT